jgi:spore maturation protein CgeB
MELAALVEHVLGGRIDRKAIAERARERLLAHHTTEKRALYVIDRLKRVFSL